MNYERFEKAAAINSEFDVIPSKTSILARGIVIDDHGYMQYKGKTYLPNMTKLSDLPGEIRDLFIEKKFLKNSILFEIVRLFEVRNKSLKSLGEIANFFLNSLEKTEEEENPVSTAMIVIEFCVRINISALFSKRILLINSPTVSPVADLKIL